VLLVVCLFVCFRSKLEQKLAEKDTQIELLTKQLAVLTKQRESSSAAEPPSNLSSSPPSIDSSTVSALKSQLRDELLSDIRRQVEQELRAQQSPASPPPTSAVPTNVASPDAVGRRPSESTLNALSLELEKSSSSSTAPPVALAKSPRAATSPTTLHHGHAKFQSTGGQVSPRSVAGLPKSGSGFSNRTRAESVYATVSMPKPSLVTNKSRILDRIMFFDKPAANANTQVERAPVTRQFSLNAARTNALLASPTAFNAPTQPAASPHAAASPENPPK